MNFKLVILIFILFIICLVGCPKAVKTKQNRKPGKPKFKKLKAPKPRLSGFKADYDFSKVLGVDTSATDGIDSIGLSNDIESLNKNDGFGNNRDELQKNSDTSDNLFKSADNAAGPSNDLFSDLGDSELRVPDGFKEASKISGHPFRTAMEKTRRNIMKKVLSKMIRVTNKKELFIDLTTFTGLNNEQKFEALKESFPLVDKPIPYKPGFNSKQVIAVREKFGGAERSFRIKKGAKDKKGGPKEQILIGTINEDYPGTKPVDRYTSTINKKGEKVGGMEEVLSDLKVPEGYKLTDDSKKKLISRRAKLIRDAIDINDGQVSGGETLKDVKWEDDNIELEIEADDEQAMSIQKSFKTMETEQIRAAVTFIAVTQIAEDAPPDDEFTEILLNTADKKGDVEKEFKRINDERKADEKPIEKTGRIPGTSKYFRLLLDKIADGQLDFSALGKKNLNVALTVEGSRNFFVGNGPVEANSLMSSFEETKKFIGNSANSKPKAQDEKFNSKSAG